MIFNYDLMVSIFETPTYNKYEDEIKKTIISYLKTKNNVKFYEHKKNLYISKNGNMKNVPCLVAHLDTVFSEQKFLIDNNLKKIIKIITDKVIALSPITNKQIGLGGDDLAGVVIALQLLDYLDSVKIAFFVEEEFGCIGSANYDVSFFDNVGYIIGIDAPTNNWISETLHGVKMFDKDFKKLLTPIFKKYGITNFSDDPYTDTLILRETELNCLNIFAGYYNYHTNSEYVNIKDMIKSANFIMETISFLKYERYTSKLSKKEKMIIQHFKS